MRNYVKAYGSFLNKVSAAKEIILWLSVAYVHHSGQN